VESPRIITFGLWRSYVNSVFARNLCVNMRLHFRREEFSCRFVYYESPFPVPVFLLPCWYNWSVYRGSPCRLDPRLRSSLAPAARYVSYSMCRCMHQTHTQNATLQPVWLPYIKKSKVNLSLYLYAQRHENVWGSAGEAPFILNLSAVLGWVRPLYSPVSFWWKLGGPQNLSGTGMEPPE
jgi:hypothetical protein